MTTYSATFREEHVKALRDHLIREDGCERAAYVLFNSAAESASIRGTGRRTASSYRPRS